MPNFRFELLALARKIPEATMQCSVKLSACQPQAASGEHPAQGNDRYFACNLPGADLRHGDGLNPA
jgi:hypothetical protein